MVLMRGMPYDMKIGNFERRAIVSTSRFETAPLNVFQNVSNEVLICPELVANELLASSRTKLNVIIFFIMVQSATQ